MIVRAIKRILGGGRRKLLKDIVFASANEQQIRLPNGMMLDFRPGHEYDDCAMFVAPHTEDGAFVDKYAKLIGSVVNLTVYDCFSGEVRILAVGSDRIFVEIMNVSPCYSCQRTPSVGSKYWVGDWEIAEWESVPTKSVFEPSDLPF